MIQEIRAGKRNRIAAAAGVCRRAVRSFNKNNRVSRTSIAKSSEFLVWVRYAVPGMLGKGNVDQMDHAIRNMPSCSGLLEIGSFCGLSTVVLSYLLEKHGREETLFTCDKWEFENQRLGELLGDSPTVTHDAYQAHVKTNFIRSLTTFSPDRLPHTIECFSDEFFRRWHSGETHVDVFGRPVKLGCDIGFCYIDGNHTYDFAKRDFENMDRVLIPGGFVLFDDSADGKNPFGVNRLVLELSGNERYELVSKKPNYLFRKL